MTYTKGMVALSIALTLGLQEVQEQFLPTGPQIRVTLQTGKSFTITTDQKGSPETVKHILDLVKKRFYDRQRVHRVEGWVVQFGAPASKTKPMDADEVLDGGSGITLPFEESKWDFKSGVVGIASEGLQKGGDSQLFILKQDALRLYRSYAVVGKVTEGMDIVGTIEKGARIKSVRVVQPKKRRN